LEGRQPIPNISRLIWPLKVLIITGLGPLIPYLS